MRPLIWLLCLFPFAVVAQFSFTTNNASLGIRRYFGSAAAVSIPSTVYGLPVTWIEDKAFAGSPQLSTISIPDTITFIGSQAFQYCVSLTNLSIGSDVTNIGVGAFSYCSNLQHITVAPVNTAYRTVSGILLNSDQTTLLRCPVSKAGTYVIPDGVTDLWDQAFENCWGLTNLVVPNSVIRMGNGTFQFCSSLVEVTLSTNTASVGAQAFQGCSRLSIVNIPYGVASIGDQAFEYCGKLKSVVIPDSVTNMGVAAFRCCTNLTSVIIGTNVIGIAGGAFMYDRSLKTVNIPESATFVGAFAFCGCQGLTSISIPGSVITIGNHAFNGCSLRSLAIDYGVTTIGERAFLSGIRDALGISIPASVTNIGEYGFSSCWGVGGFYFAGNAPTVGPDLFQSTVGVTVYYIPGTLGWSNSFGNRPTSPWIAKIEPPDKSDLQSNKLICKVTGFGEAAFAIEVSTNLLQGNWTTLVKRTFTNGAGFFRDPWWDKYPSRFYRGRMP